MPRPLALGGVLASILLIAIGMNGRTRAARISADPQVAA